MVTAPWICQTHLSLPSKPHCFTLGQPLPLGPISLLTGLLPSAPMGHPSHSARKFSISCKRYWTIILVKAFQCLPMKLNSSAWPRMLFTGLFLPNSCSLSSILTLHSILWFPVSQIHHTSVYQTLFIGRPTSWWLTCPQYHLCYFLHTVLTNLIFN